MSAFIQLPALLLSIGITALALLQAIVLVLPVHRRAGLGVAVGLVAGLGLMAGPPLSDLAVLAAYQGQLITTPAGVALGGAWLVYSSAGFPAGVAVALFAMAYGIDTLAARAAEVADQD